MSNTKVTLYHADWCGHCQKFKPVWKALTSLLDKKNIQYDDFEDNKNANEVAAANIQGFPTILISKNGETYQYNGDRSLDGLVREVIPDLQIGGSKIILKNYKINYTKNTIIQYPFLCDINL